MTTIRVQEEPGVTASIGNEKDLETKIFTALGEVSVCWSNIKDAGVFDSERATAIGEKLLEDVRAYVK